MTNLSRSLRTRSIVGAFYISSIFYQAVQGSENLYPWTFCKLYELHPGIHILLPQPLGLQTLGIGGLHSPGIRTRHLEGSYEDYLSTYGDTSLVSTATKRIKGNWCPYYRHSLYAFKLGLGFCCGQTQERRVTPPTNHCGGIMPSTGRFLTWRHREAYGPMVTNTYKCPALEWTFAHYLLFGQILAAEGDLKFMLVCATG